MGSENGDLGVVFHLAPRDTLAAVFEQNLQSLKHNSRQRKQPCSWRCDPISASFRLTFWGSCFPYDQSKQPLCQRSIIMQGLAAQGFPNFLVSAICRELTMCLLSGHVITSAVVLAALPMEVYQGRHMSLALGTGFALEI